MTAARQLDPGLAWAGLREIARSLSGAHDLGTTLDLIAAKTAEVMAVDSCSIYLLDDDTLWLRASTGLSRQAVGRGSLALGEGLTGWAASHNEPIAAAEAQADPRFKFVPYTGERAFHSLLAVPLVSEGRVTGAMNVQTYAPHAFSEAEIALLSLIADLAAGVLKRASLSDNLNRQLAELKTLARVSQTINQPLYLDDMLNVVVEMAAKVMGAAVCTLRLVDEAQEGLVVRAAAAQIEGYEPKPTLRLDEGINGLVLSERKPQTVLDVRVDPRFPFREAAAREGLVRMLAVPLIVRDRAIGVLNAFTTQPHTYTEAEIGLLSTLANQTALAIENAQLVTSASIVREMHHRVRNNLQQVAMLLRLQAQQSGDPNGHLHVAVNRVQAIAAVHEVLAQEGYRLVNVREVAERIVRLRGQHMTQPGLSLHMEVDGEDVLLPSRAATSLALVINELLENAIEHAFVGRSEGSVRIHCVQAGADYRIDVSDDGVGMPAAPSDSLGLEIVTALVRDDLHGSLVFLPRAGCGTRATVQLPRPAQVDVE